MQISPADEQVLSLFSSLEKQSLYQVVCAATPTDGTRNAYEKAAIKEIVEVIKLTDTEMQASRRLTNNIMIDTLRNMSQMKKMGGLTSILSMLPGMGLPKDLDIPEDATKGVEAIIYSMTMEERTNPDILNPSRKKRIAKGAGVDIAEVNRVVKQFEQARKMMKQMSGMMSGKKRGKFKMPFGL